MNKKQALVFKKLDSLMYHVDDLDEGIAFFKQFGLEPETIRRDIGWCNLHMQDDDLCIDLSTAIPGNGEPHYLVEDTQAFYEACLEAGIEIVREPFEVVCGECVIIRGPSSITLNVLDLSKMDKESGE